MSRFTESADFSFTFVETIAAPETFTFPKAVGQFNVTADFNCTVQWDKNTGDPYPLLSGESLTVPCITTRIFIVPDGGGQIRIMGLG